MVVILYRITRTKQPSGANKDTHTWPAYKTAFHKARMSITMQGKPCISVDPFARNCRWAKYRNDIDEDTEAEYHMDAIQFLSKIHDDVGLVDLILFDPPYSQRQTEEKYGQIANVYTTPGYVKDIFEIMVKMLSHRGRIIKLGYNSTRHSDCLELVDMEVLNFGGNRNDVIMTTWERTSKNWRDYNENDRLCVNPVLVYVDDTGQDIYECGGCWVCEGEEE